MKTLIIMAAASYAALTQAPSPPPQDATDRAVFAELAAVQRRYRGKTFRADFEQSYTDAVLGAKPTERGALLASGDGRVHFAYAAPNLKTFVYDGNNAYFYEPEAAQVTVMMDFKDTPAAHTMAFLWGQGALSEDFAAARCRAGCPPLQPFERAITLLPRQALPGIERVDIVVDHRTHEVTCSVLIDPLGNRTRYVLRGRKLGAPIDDATFTFQVPEGVSVLRTRSDGALTPSAPRSRGAP